MPRMMWRNAEKDTMKILSYDDLRTVKGVVYSRVHLWRLEKAGQFPKRVSSAARHGWVDSEVDDWLAARLAERDAPEVA
jgi:prophage regulatory protein